MAPTKLFRRRDLLGALGTAALAAQSGLFAAEKRPRIACVVTYWGGTSSHADWILSKLLDGYWFQGAHVPPRLDIVSVHIDKLDDSVLGRAVCERKKIPLLPTVREALTLGGGELAVDGVALVGEHGDYHSNLLGQKYYPRWWLYQQIVEVFERSRRSVPVFNDKHLSTSWDEAKWMFDKSRELDFPLFGGSSIPYYYREPAIDLEPETPIRASVLAGGSSGEGSLFHSIDVAQSFVERRKGGETGVAAVQCIRGREVWSWTERNPWAGGLLDAVGKRFDFQPGHFQETVREPSVTLIDYRDGTKTAIYDAPDVGWTYACDIAGQAEPTLVSMLGWPGRQYGHYRAGNAFEHWITQMMLTRQEPCPAERLLLSTGLTAFNMQSNWQNGRYSAVGRRVETPYLDMTYRRERSAMFNTGPRPPVLPDTRHLG
ncbi:MAG: hypothetical protein GC160_07585 [Acidobacteria bacterium]|nr:hypothetical protein [Acidobacteriota bacterium]